METAARLELDNRKLIVRSPIVQKLLVMVERVARHPASVLIVGETGSGKELIARAVHKHSLRSAKPFVDVNCAALPEHLACFDHGFPRQPVMGDKCERQLRWNRGSVLGSP